MRRGTCARVKRCLRRRHEPRAQGHRRSCSPTWSASRRRPSSSTRRTSRRSCFPTTSGCATSSNAGAERWRSSSATRLSRSSAHPPPARTIPSAPCVRRSPSATGSRGGQARSAHRREHRRGARHLDRSPRPARGWPRVTSSTRPRACRPRPRERDHGRRDDVPGDERAIDYRDIRAVDAKGKGSP